MALKKSEGKEADPNESEGNGISIPIRVLGELNSNHDPSP